VTLPAYAIEESCRLKREQAEELLRLGVRQAGDTLVCARTDGEPLQPRSLTHEFAVMRPIKDVPRVRFPGPALEASQRSRREITWGAARAGQSSLSVRRLLP
jgi:hypothetical protein